ncbi:MAG: hypothetical protein JST39_17425, partial [Bacteroidetes bacterium]|nr:hypothetical protein [Bacteroidota bacterium]
MNQQQQGLEALQDIKRIMERSGRFISLSGWSGVAAGLCALVGAGLAEARMASYRELRYGNMNTGREYQAHGNLLDELTTDLLLIGIGVFISAVTLAFIFTYVRSRKNKVPIWGTTARRLLWNTMLPLIVGGIVVLNTMQMGY